MGAELGRVKFKSYNFDPTEFVLRRQIMLNCCCVLVKTMLPKYALFVLRSRL